ncbi:MAG: aminotransferase class V-fold PLP-dependent enzyme [Verrucomicrobia bacterium]|nr:aminotransferase class V-fold PLP-dependent enzyme [Verrucomicrobiota bacterium]
MYLDHNATTPIAPEVLEVMMPYLTSEWGNPSSSYKFGAKLKGVIETARAQVAELIGAQSREVIFTSCATESNNAAIHSALKANPGKRHIITSGVEHSSVLNLCRALERNREWTRMHANPAPKKREVIQAAANNPLSRPADTLSPSDGERDGVRGYRVTYLPVDRDGLLKLADLENAITDDTAVVSLMWANNETGVLFPVKEIAEICRARGVLYHCDAVQAAGKMEIDVRKVPADYLSLAGHKFHAPKGIGALYVRRKAPFSPLIHGGHQERNLRGGTECVPLIVGLGKAAELARKHQPSYENKVGPLRDALEQGILNSIPNTELNGHPIHRLANTTNITFPGIESEALLILLDQEGICASSGSACLADSDEPSHVVKAMKPDSTASRQMIRFSLDLANTAAEVKAALPAIERAVKMLRG